MGFNAAQEVEALDYDFTTLKPLPEGLENAKGTVPEPSTTRVEAFAERYFRLNDLLASINADEPDEEDDSATAGTPEITVMGALQTWLDEQEAGVELSPAKIKADQVYIDLLAFICQGHPSREEIAAMPARIRAAFLGWLVEELLTPKGMKSGTNPSLAVVANE